MYRPLANHIIGGGGVVPQVNKFEQVSNDDHQMLVVGEGMVPRSYEWYYVTYPMMHVMYLPHSPSHPDARGNITFPQLRLQAVIMTFLTP